MCGASTKKLYTQIILYQAISKCVCGASTKKLYTQIILYQAISKCIILSEVIHAFQILIAMLSVGFIEKHIHSDPLPLNPLTNKAMFQADMLLPVNSENSPNGLHMYTTRLVFGSFKHGIDIHSA